MSEITGMTDTVGSQLPQEMIFHPVTAERWPDLETLFGARGACGGCWCMWWRLKRSEYEQSKGEPNRVALHALVTDGETPGLLAYHDGQAIGWCAVAPRSSYPVLDRSRTLKRVDDELVWSVVCFFVAKPYRRQGVSARLLEAAIRYAAEQGATVLEGYPVEPRTAKMPDAFAWTGTPSSFHRAGFVEVVRRSPTRPIMRYRISSRSIAGDRAGSTDPP
jgi:GNAT superfamily N-acetyltransferase